MGCLRPLRYFFDLFFFTRGTEPCAAVFDIIRQFVSLRRTHTRLVFIDETAVSTNMVRLRGRAARGVRVIGTVPLGAWETITFVAALRHNKITAPMVLEGAMTGEMFLAYVKQCLVPTLRRNDIVVMDNCKVHMGLAIREAIEKVQATLRYLPSYSPDLNPIEMPYSKFKQFLRKVAARTVPGLTSHSLVHPTTQPSRMHQLFQACRLCFNMIGIRFSLARPGGNLTGITNFEFTMGGKWLETLKEISPQLARVAVLYNPKTAPYAGSLLRSVAACSFIRDGAD